MFSLKSIGMRASERCAAKPPGNLIAMNAAVPAGSMDLIPTYIARKQGKETPSIRTRASNRFWKRPTHHGLPGQVMQTAQILAAIRWAAPTCLRRRNGQEGREEMASQRKFSAKVPVSTA